MVLFILNLLTFIRKPIIIISALIFINFQHQRSLKCKSLTDLPKGIYTVKMTDISGAYWEHKARTKLFQK
ncbi:hypothetical protein P700755_000234 [Psychroflexus torquis ATCC 700755]|uniref:Uncharacterized protein n=1 Tax=Psychroflexus torquis (strain ATCC 700755 / CIP 106069 / ACAM 623) TaxID=313595 RepID=K4IP18_PSYTT|nr:hypothetical protein P700755_000234 [Psychroflexus torquis ATCC 700755]